MTSRRVMVQVPSEATFLSTHWSSSIEGYFNPSITMIAFFGRSYEPGEFWNIRSWASDLLLLEKVLGVFPFSWYDIAADNISRVFNSLSAGLELTKPCAENERDDKRNWCINLKSLYTGVQSLELLKIIDREAVKTREFLVVRWLMPRLGNVCI